ncbi:MarR family winged helix-turn-helix transcriptional regulator [Pseudonocardia halophobica]|uniref:MarR family transcriptional regulator n=1 Tax=Pseudonocardia halophobica TaxID=29401 RepID=A0A9W6NWI8_9PSEU|nr:MarR family transcriptional regulator [Pseudonocardia halophobica]GLL11713.1 MarR family transcriptional regulator [Pseudonocardia halophobica]
MTAPRELDPADPAVRAWGRMRALVVDQHDRRREACEAVGLSFVRVKALLEVAREPGTLSDLADRLSVDRPYATVVVDELQKRGLVRREHHPDDRRCKIVSATPDGLRAAATARAILGDPPPVLRALPAEDLAQLDRILAAL